MKDPVLFGGKADAQCWGVIMRGKGATMDHWDLEGLVELLLPLAKTHGIPLGIAVPLDDVEEGAEGMCIGVPLAFARAVDEEDMDEVGDSDDEDAQELASGGTVSRIDERKGLAVPDEVWAALEEGGVELDSGDAQLWLAVGGWSVVGLHSVVGDFSAASDGEGMEPIPEDALEGEVLLDVSYA